MGIGYLVAQHGKELGAGCVEKVTIFFSSDKYWEKPNILFCLGGVEEDEESKKEKAVTKVHT